MTAMTETTKSAEAESPLNGKPAKTSVRKTLKAKVLGGSLTLLAGSGAVGVTNLIYNVATARLLGPSGFAHATVAG